MPEITSALSGCAFRQLSANNMISALLASAVVTLTIPPPRALDLDLMLDVIAQTEAWDGHSVGRAGEIGPWQITPAVWSRYMHGTMRGAPLEQLRYVAFRHVSDLIKQLKARGHAVTPFNVGLAYNGGIGLVGQKTVPRAKFEYATRCENLFDSQKK